MSALDVFNADAFSFTSLTKSVNQMGYVPSTLGKIPGLLEKIPIRTEAVWIERRGYTASIIPFSARGTPASQVGSDQTDARAFKTKRIAEGSTIRSHELLNVRRFGSEIDIKDLAYEVDRRMFKVVQNMTLTEEYHLLNLVTKGKMLDSDGSTVYDWTVEFASPPKGAEVLSAVATQAFAFSATVDDGGVRKKSNTLYRGIIRNLQMGNLPIGNVEVVGLADDTFYDGLTTSAEVRDTFKNWEAAAALRSSVGQPWQPFAFAGINYINYRGTDDNSTVAVPSGTCKFFPTGAGIFQKAIAPGEKFEDLGSEGQEKYAQIVRDVQRDQWAEVEVASYPLYVCTMPQALAAGTA